MRAATLQIPTDTGRIACGGQPNLRRDDMTVMAIETLRALPTAELLRVVDRATPQVRALAERVERAEAACLGALAGEAAASADITAMDEAERLRSASSHLLAVVRRAHRLGVVSGSLAQQVEAEAELNFASLALMDQSMMHA